MKQAVKHIPCAEVVNMKPDMPEGVTVINRMADGSICEDLSAYLVSPDQLSDLTKRLLAEFMLRGEQMGRERGE